MINASTIFLERNFSSVRERFNATLTKIVFYAINSTMRFNCHLFEPNPNQNGAANMISDSSGFPALVAFDASQLLGLPVKFLDLPSKAAHILYDLQVVLSHLVRNDIISALEMDEDQIVHGLWIDIFQQLAWCYYDPGAYDEALNYCQKAISRHSHINSTGRAPVP